MQQIIIFQEAVDGRIVEGSVDYRANEWLQSTKHKIIDIQYVGYPDNLIMIWYEVRS